MGRDLQPVQVDLQRRLVDLALEAETGALGAGRGAEPFQRGRVDDQVELQFRGFQADHAVGQTHLADQHGPGRGGGGLFRLHRAAVRAGQVGGVAPAAVGQLFEVDGRLLVHGPLHVHPFFEQGREVQVQGQERVAEHIFPFALDVHAVDGEPAGEQVGGERTDTGGVGAVPDEPVLQSLLQADGQQQEEQGDAQGQGGEHPDPGFAKERRDPGAHGLQVGHGWCSVLVMKRRGRGPVAARPILDLRPAAHGNASQNPRWGRLCQGDRAVCRPIIAPERAAAAKVIEFAGGWDTLPGTEKKVVIRAGATTGAGHPRPLVQGIRDGRRDNRR